MGIFQSIGFKEFHNYVTLSERERGSEVGQKLLLEGSLDIKHTNQWRLWLRAYVCVRQLYEKNNFSCWHQTW